MSEATSPKRLSEQIADRVARQIMSGTFRAGDALLSEREMMIAFSVGRTTIREALQRLEQQGLIEIHHGRKARVRMNVMPRPQDLAAATLQMLGSDTEHFIRDLKEVRTALEIAMSERAAQIATQSDIARLRRALEDNRRAICDSDAYLRTDIAFHRTIASITGNAIFMEAAASILEWLAHFRKELVHVEGANLLSHDEHTAIADAIAAGDPAAAANAMRQHQLRSNALYARLLAQHPEASKAQKKLAKPIGQKSRRKPQWPEDRLRRSSR